MGILSWPLLIVFHTSLEFLDDHDFCTNFNFAFCFSYQFLVFISNIYIVFIVSRFVFPSSLESVL